MKIGVDLRVLMDSEYSGVSWYVFNLLQEILKQDKKNKYILYYNSGKKVSGKIFDFSRQNAVIAGTKYPNKIFNYILQRIFHFPKLDKLSAKAINEKEIDIFWLPHFNFSSFSKNCKKILTVHDLSFLRYPEFFSYRKIFWHRFLGVKKIISEADAIIAISENTKKDIIDLIGVSENKIKVIYPGISPQFKALDKNAEEFKKIKEKYNLPEKFILYIGTIEPRKNISGLIEAFDALEDEKGDWHLLIAGGQGWKDKNIFNSFRRAKKRDKINFLGYINEEEKVYFYNLASLFVYPSFYEGFGFPPLEAQACGTPVVAGNVSSLPQALGTSAILIDPNNINALKDAIKNVLSDEALGKELIARGLQNIKRFDWAKTAEEYLKIFKN